MNSKVFFLLQLYLTNKYRVYIFHFSPIWSDIYHMGSFTYSFFCLMCIHINSKKISISPFWNKILKIWGTLFELIYMYHNAAKISSKFSYNKLELLEVTQERIHKSYTQNWQICILYIYGKYLLCLQSNASGSFLQACINFAEQELNFFYFEGSIIPWGKRLLHLWNLPRAKM